MLFRSIPEDVKKERREKLMHLQQKISLEKNREFIGKNLEMLVEHIEHKDENKARVVGRSFRDAPEIDGQLYIKLNQNKEIPNPGEFINVKVVSCDEYDLFCTKLT